MLLEYQRSYLWLCGVLAIVWGASLAVAAIAFGHAMLASPIFPIIVLFLLVSQLRSGVALDGRWVAAYKKGSWGFTTGIATHLAALGFSTYFVVSAFQSLPGLKAILG